MTVASHGYLEVDEPSDVKVRRAVLTPGVLIVLGNDWTITSSREAALAMASRIIAVLNEDTADNVLRMPPRRRPAGEAST